MRLPRRLPRFPTRHALAVAALFAQLVVAIGAPMPSRSTKNVLVPFPCQNHPCGCSTSEEGWAGDCCCFTLEEKIAWAEARGIEPPLHARAAVEARKAAKKQKPKSCCANHAKPSCCESEPEDKPVAATSEVPAVRWVAGMFAQKCRGESPAGVLKFEVSVPPAQPQEVRASLPDCGRVVAVDSQPFPVPARPPIPPPRAS